MRLDYARCDGVLFRISLSWRLRLVQTAALQPWGGPGCGWGEGDNIIIFADDLLPCRVAAIRTPNLAGAREVRESLASGVDAIRPDVSESVAPSLPPFGSCLRISALNPLRQIYCH